MKKAKGNNSILPQAERLSLRLGKTQTANADFIEKSEKRVIKTPTLSARLIAMTDELNNIGYGLERLAILIPYNWTASYTYYSDWESDWSIEWGW